jgi:hypothetical protein
MATRLRSTWLAGGSALLLVLAISGIAAGATLVADSTQPAVDQAEPLEGDTDTTLTFEDVDGDGIDDDCDDAVVADAEAAAAAMTAADENGDGTISVSEAAHSGWVAGANCNHGGYVSTIAHTSGDTCEEGETPEDTTPDGTTPDEGGAEDADDADEAVTPVVASTDGACADESEEAADETAPEPAVCEAAPVEEPAPAEETPVDTAPNAHGKAVSDVAHDKAAVGGKNCNHGGAVSEAAKKDHGAKHAHLHGKSAGKGHGKGHNKP